MSETWKSYRDITPELHARIKEATVKAARIYRKKNMTQAQWLEMAVKCQEKADKKRESKERQRERERIKKIRQKRKDASVTKSLSMSKT